MGRYKNFRDGLFRVGDIVEVTCKSYGRGTLNRTFTDVVIDQINKTSLAGYQHVTDAVAPGNRDKMQYLTFDVREVIEVTPITSQAWANEYAPASPGVRPRRQRRPSLDFNTVDDEPFVETRPREDTESPLEDWVVLSPRYGTHNVATANA